MLVQFNKRHVTFFTTLVWNKRPHLKLYDLFFFVSTQRQCMNVQKRSYVNRLILYSLSTLWILTSFKMCYFTFNSVFQIVENATQIVFQRLKLFWRHFDMTVMWSTKFKSKMLGGRCIKIRIIQSFCCFCFV